MRHPDFRYVLQSSDGKNNPRVVPIKTALAEIRNGARWDVHRSIARYDDTLPAYQREHGHIRGFNGPCYADYLRFDVDRDGPLDGALADTRRLALTLCDHYGVGEDHVRYFISGSKGFELALPMVLCGDVNPSAHTPATLKRMALAIAEYAGKITLDMGIYRRLGTMRVLATQHPARPPAGQSIRWKTELTWAEFSTWTVDQMLQLATADPPRELEYRPHDLEPIDALVELHARSALDAEEYAARPRPEPVRVRGEPISVEAVAELIRPYYVDGRRHDVSLWLAGYLAKSGIDQQQAEAVIGLIAKRDDDNGEKSLERVQYTYSAVAEGEDVRGYTGLVEILSEDGMRDLAALVEPSKNGHAAEPEPPILPQLPGEFWETRSVLKHIRQSAHSRNRSAQAVLHCVLARVAAFLPPAAKVDTGIASPASLNYYAALVDPSGAGKSSPQKIARDLIEPPPDYGMPDPLPLGSGEGMAEAYMGTVEVERPGANGKPKTDRIRAQVRYNANFYVDEGQALTRQLERAGTTIGEALRRGWVGETLGQFNATIERTRVVNDYSLGLIIGFQPSALLPLFGDAGLGTPQRFCFTGCTDPTIPDEPPEWPGRIDLRIYGTWTGYTLADEIKSELRKNDTAVARGQLTRDPIDRHEPLHLVKLATLLATLENRRLVNTEDWRLARMIWEVSCATRNMLIDYGKDLRKAQQREETREHVGRTLAADRARDRDQATVECVAKVIAWKVRRATAPVSRRDAVKATASRDRKFADRAIAHAVRMQWIAEREDGRYEPGAVQP